MKKDKEELVNNEEQIKENKKKEKQDKKKNKENKEKKSNKFIETIKKKWLIDGTKTSILVLIIIAIFIAINILMQKLEITPIDFTQEKLYTITDESKEKVKNIEKDINIYFIGYDSDNTNLNLARQYKKANEKINVEAVDINSRPDLVQKYGIESGTQGIIIECGEKAKVLTDNDLVTYDMTTYEPISIAEEKLTSSIQAIATEKVPKVYFLNGYSKYSLNENMNLLNAFLENEINEIDTLNILSVGKVPDDCDTLVITTPNKDFDDIATNAILDYIKSGRNILWLNGAITSNAEMPNVNKVLAEYGIKPFEIGVIRETDADKMVTNSPDLIIPNIESSKVTKDLYNTTGVILINATKINIDTDKLEELKVEETDLLTTEGTAYFRTDFTNKSKNASEGEAVGPFVIGTELEKTITEADEEKEQSAIKSKLVIYGENYFISDYQLSENSQYTAIQLAYNKDLVLNSIAYLVDREEDIIVRKTAESIDYTATEKQDTIIRAIIFTIPVLIIIIGIVVWRIRRRKK